MKFRKNAPKVGGPRLPRVVTIDVGRWLKEGFHIGKKNLSADENKRPQFVNIDGGFRMYYSSGAIGEVFCQDNALCVVYFRDGTTKEVRIEHGEDSRMYGIHFSHDGHTLLNISWEKGVFAYDVMSGTKLWHFRSTRISKLYVYESYVVARKYGEAIIKLDIASGEKLAELRSGSIETSWMLCGPYILVSWFRGKLSVIETETMSIYKQYSKQIENPSNVISCLVQDAFLKKNKLIIKGLEGGCRAFERVVDSEFLPVEKV